MCARFIPESLVQFNLKSQAETDDKNKLLPYSVNMKIGTKLLKIRRALGVSQDRIAEYAGVTKASVSQWEHGTSLPSLKHLLILREHITFSFDDLLLDESNIDQDDLKNKNQHIESDKTIADIQKLLNKLNNNIKLKEYAQNLKDEEAKFSPRAPTQKKK